MMGFAQRSGFRLRTAAGFGFLGVLALTMPTPAQAATQGFGISPTSQEVSLQPGDTTKGTVTVINDGDTDVTYHLYATDYRVKDETYAGDFTDEHAATKVSPVTWFSLPSGNAVVKARQQVDVPYTLKVPVGASVGGHYAAVFAETVPPPARAGALIARIDRVGSLFYLGVGGNLQPAGSIAGFTVPWLQAVPPLTGTLRLRNTGNIHYAAEVTARLSTPFGPVGKEQKLRGEVLPQTTRRFELSLPSGSPIGLYKVSAEVKYLGHTQTVSQWMVLMPQLTFVIVSGTVLLLLVLGLWGLMRRARRRRSDRLS